MLPARTAPSPLGVQGARPVRHPRAGRYFCPTRGGAWRSRRRATAG
nr:MAG TPA: hypothetical protein [Caudoviricetes sp.]